MWWHLRWDGRDRLGFGSSALWEGMPEGKNRRYKPWRLEGQGPTQDSEESGAARA